MNVALGRLLLMHELYENENGSRLSIQPAFGRKRVVTTNMLPNATLNICYGSKADSDLLMLSPVPKIPFYVRKGIHR